MLRPRLVLGERCGTKRNKGSGTFRERPHQDIPATCESINQLKVPTCNSSRAGLQVALQTDSQPLQQGLCGATFGDIDTGTEVLCVGPHMGTPDGSLFHLTGGQRI